MGHECTNDDAIRVFVKHLCTACARSPAGCFQSYKGALRIEPDGHAASGASAESPFGPRPSGPRARRRPRRATRRRRSR